MKKLYIQPIVNIVPVRGESMIAISNISGADGLGINGTTKDAGITEGAVKEDLGWDVWN